MALWAQLILGAAAVFILLPLDVTLLRGIGSDVAMLIDAFGLVGGLADLRQPNDRDPLVVAVLRPDDGDAPLGRAPVVRQ